MLLLAVVSSVIMMMIIIIILRLGPLRFLSNNRNKEESKSN